MIRLLFLITLVFNSQIGWAQTPPPAGSGSTSSQSFYDLGLKAGSFLPYDIVGVRELLPIASFVFGHGLSSTTRLEYHLSAANAKGITYYNGALSVRYDFKVLETLPLFFLIGLDAHVYKRKNTSVTNSEFPFRTVTGWHTGVGGEANIFSDVFFRIDVKLGFSPGRQMLLTGGLILRF